MATRGDRYLPMAGDFINRNMSYVVRSTRVGVTGFLRELQQTVWSITPGVPLGNMRTLDGILARKLNQVSDFGKILDPYADSTFRLSCFFAFASQAHGKWIPIWMVMVLFYRFGLHKPVTPPWTIVFLPFLVLGTSLLSLGMAYLLAALTVTYRDFRFIIQFAVQIWMWVSFVMIPVPGNMLGRKMAWVVLYANPMYGYVSTYRKILVPNVEMWSPWNWTMIRL